jgi:hypothetical protein
MGCTGIGGLKIMPDPTPKYKSEKELSKAIESYFRECDEKEEPYTVTGLAISIGLSRCQLLQYQSKAQYYNTIKKAKDRCEAFAERQLYQGRNVAGVIFSLKNNWKWRDQQDLNVSNDTKAPDPISDDITEAEAAEIYRNVMG